MIGETGETSNGARELLQQMILHLRADILRLHGAAGALHRPL